MTPSCDGSLRFRLSEWEGRSARTGNQRRAKGEENDKGNNRSLLLRLRHAQRCVARETMACRTVGMAKLAVVCGGMRLAMLIRVLERVRQRTLLEQQKGEDKK